MTKRTITITLVIAIFLMAAQFAIAQSLPVHQLAVGNWKIVGNRVYQYDTDETLAKANIFVPQVGKMSYKFNVRYEGHGNDLHGGFGIHVFADSATVQRSWGTGESYLLWLNYDANPLSADIPKGFSAQVYKSNHHFSMDLVESVDLNHYVKYMTTQTAKMIIPITIYVDGTKGMVKVVNPGFPNRYFEFSLGERNMTGQWIALRTNGMALSWGLQ